MESTQVATDRKMNKQITAYSRRKSMKQFLKHTAGKKPDTEEWIITWFLKTQIQSLIIKTRTVVAWGYRLTGYKDKFWGDGNGLYLYRGWACTQVYALVKLAWTLYACWTSVGTFHYLWLNLNTSKKHKRIFKTT